MEFFRWQEKQLEKEDFYLAQIAAEVRRTIVKKPKSVKLRDFLLRTNEDEMKMEKSKSAWAAHLKVDLRKN